MSTRNSGTGVKNQEKPMTASEQSVKSDRCRRPEAAVTAPIRLSAGNPSLEGRPGLLCPPVPGPLRASEGERTEDS